MASSDDNEVLEPSAPKKRGRPRKVTVSLKKKSNSQDIEEREPIVFDKEGNEAELNVNRGSYFDSKSDRKEPENDHTLFDSENDFSFENFKSSSSATSESASNDSIKFEDTTAKRISPSFTIYSTPREMHTTTFIGLNNGHTSISSETSVPQTELNQNSDLSYQHRTLERSNSYDNSQSEQGYSEQNAYQQTEEQAQNNYRQNNYQSNSYEQNNQPSPTHYSTGSQRYQRNSSRSQNQGYQRQGRGKSQNQNYNQIVEEEENPNAPVLLVNTLNVLSLQELRTLGVEQYNINPENVFDLKKQELICEILKSHAYAGGVIHTEGTLEILQDGYGFLRSELNSYLSGPEDVFVSPQIIKSFALRTGDTVYGMLRNPKASERFFAVVKVLKVNGADPQKTRTRIPFDSLTPLYPNSLINLETKEEDISMRVINLFDPIGKGQRALITAPPRTGKTILLQKIANAITTNHPEISLMVLLVDERPEEVTDMRRSVKGEVVASTFDEQATRHVQVAEMVIEKAKRLVEYGKDVVILLDSITRLARAYNQTVPASGKILSGGVDSNALHKPKRFFGAARNIENGGSLTIIASALIETGSRMDEVIFEEFKGTGNCEIVLDRKMADKRLFPAINLKKSGTRREDLIVDSATLARIYALRGATGTFEDLEMTEWVLDKMKKTSNNKAFIDSMGMSDSVK